MSPIPCLEFKKNVSWTVCPLAITKSLDCLSRLQQLRSCCHAPCLCACRPGGKWCRTVAPSSGFFENFVPWSCRAWTWAHSVLSAAPQTQCSSQTWLERNGKTQGEMYALEWTRWRTAHILHCAIKFSKVFVKDNKEYKIQSLPANVELLIWGRFLTQLTSSVFF